MQPTASAFLAALATSARSPDIPESADLYGFLVGSWELDVLHYWGVDVSAKGINGELHAIRILEGRAIQDLWIMPPRGQRPTTVDKKLNMYGTTLRLWDSTLAAWRITWRNPAADHHEDQIGRRNGPDIEQAGTRPDGTKTRWRFTEITADSFHWLGESATAGVDSWTLEGEFRARRTH